MRGFNAKIVSCITPSLSLSSKGERDMSDELEARRHWYFGSSGLLIRHTLSVVVYSL